MSIAHSEKHATKRTFAAVTDDEHFGISELAIAEPDRAGSFATACTLVLKHRREMSTKNTKGAKNTKDLSEPVAKKRKQEFTFTLVCTRCYRAAECASVARKRACKCLAETA